MTDTHEVRVRFTRRKGSLRKGMTEWYPQQRAQRLIDEGYAVLDMPTPMLNEEKPVEKPTRRSKRKKKQEVKVEEPVAESAEAETTDATETTETTSEEMTNG